MKTQWTQVYKPQVIETLEKAGISPSSEVAKVILTFERRVNTLINMNYNGSSWDAICHSPASLDANRCLARLNGSAMSRTESLKAEFGEEWSRYCEAKGICPEANLGDWLS